MKGIKMRNQTILAILIGGLIILVSLLIVTPFAEAGVKAVKIGEVTNIDRIGPRDDKIKVLRIDDPENPFVSIYLTHVKSGKFTAIADPSNTSIACRLTGKIPVKDGKQVINTKTNLDIGHFRKSIGSKIMRIARWYDRGKHALVYVVYTTKILDGSSKHSLSVVPLAYPLR
jgi:CreA protein